MGACASSAGSFPPRPEGADGEWLRVISVNDVYKLDNLAQLKAAIVKAKAEAPPGCTVIATLNGDFMSPCLFTALDGGHTMAEALEQVGFDYVCLGNHEFDIGVPQLAEKLSKAYHGTVLNSNVLNDELSIFPSHVSLRLGERTVVLCGLCTTDTAIYNPANLPTFLPMMQAVERAWAAVVAEGKPPAAMLALTHQLIAEDRAFATKLAAHGSLAGKVPLILGGHEHEVYVETAGDSLIVKMGADAALIGVADLWFDSSGKPFSALRAQIPAKDFSAAADMAAYAKKKEKWAADMMSAEIACLTQPMTSNDVRHSPSLLASTLLTMIKDGLARQNVELVLLHGGSVRGKHDYPSGAAFTLGHLYSELAFPTELAVVELPGSVIAECIRWTRTRPTPAPELMHADLGVEIDASTHAVLKIGGKPFSASRTYRVAVLQLLLTGLNNVEPLMAHVKSGALVPPPADSCIPAKLAVIEGAMKKAWLELAGYGSGWDADRDGTISPAEMSAALERTFRTIDSNSDKLLERKELVAYLEKTNAAKKDGKVAKLSKMASSLSLGKTASSSLSLITQMVKSLDANQDGKISLEELQALVAFDSSAPGSQSSKAKSIFCY